MTHNQRVEPGRINHPVATAIGVLIMIGVIVLGVVLWVRGSSEEVRIGDTGLGAPVPVEAAGGRVTAYPIETTVSTFSGDPLRTTTLKVEVVRSTAIKPCAPVFFPEVQVDASYTAALPVDQATGLPSTSTSSYPLDREVPAEGEARVSFTVGPVTQSAGTLAVTVVRPIVVLANGAELGTQSIALATTPEIVQAYIDAVHRLDPTARQEQDQCAKAELAKIDDVLNTSSLENEPLRRLRQVYVVLSGDE